MGAPLNNPDGIALIQKNINKRIREIRHEDNVLIVVFEDGNNLIVSDERQDCCEIRYMQIDDNLKEYVDATFLGIEEKPSEVIDDTGDVHEVQFVEILTSKGPLSVANHNEHNGYYGGFAVRIGEAL